MLPVSKQMFFRLVAANKAFTRLLESGNPPENNRVWVGLRLSCASCITSFRGEIQAKAAQYAINIHRVTWRAHKSPTARSLTVWCMLHTKSVRDAIHRFWCCVATMSTFEEDLICQIGGIQSLIEALGNKFKLGKLQWSYSYEKCSQMCF